MDLRYFDLLTGRRGNTLSEIRADGRAFNGFNPVGALAHQRSHHSAAIVEDVEDVTEPALTQDGLRNNKAHSANEENSPLAEQTTTNSPKKPTTPPIKKRTKLRFDRR